MKKDNVQSSLCNNILCFLTNWLCMSIILLVVIVHHPNYGGGVIFHCDFFLVGVSLFLYEPSNLLVTFFVGSDYDFWLNFVSIGNM